MIMSETPALPSLPIISPFIGCPALVRRSRFIGWLSLEIYWCNIGRPLETFPQHSPSCLPSKRSAPKYSPNKTTCKPQIKTHPKMKRAEEILPKCIRKFNTLQKSRYLDGYKYIDDCFQSVYRKFYSIQRTIL